MISSPPSSLLQDTIGAQQPSMSIVDITGLIAGAILIGAGLLLYTGNIDIIKNPLVAIGCGILLIGSALKRIVL
jgi:hypothetical protein